MAQAPSRPTVRYTFTADDVVWMARFVTGEAGGRDNPENDAVMWAMFNRFALFTYRNALLLGRPGPFATFSEFLRAYSTPLQPYLKNPGAVEAAIKAAQRNPGRLEWVQWGTFRHQGRDIPKGQYRHHLRLQERAWSDPSMAAAARLALAAARGERRNPIGLASEFANTAVYFRRRHDRTPTRDEWLAYNRSLAQQKGWQWIGDVPGIEQYRRNTFFLDRRAAGLDPSRTVTLARP